MAQSVTDPSGAGAEPWASPASVGIVPVTPPKPGFGSSEFYLTLIWALVMAAVAMHVIPEGDAIPVRDMLTQLITDAMSMAAGLTAVWKYAHDRSVVKNIFHNAQASVAVALATAPAPIAPVAPVAPVLPVLPLAPIATLASVPSFDSFAATNKTVAAPALPPEAFKV
jgi:hypothetical protein